MLSQHKALTVKGAGDLRQLGIVKASVCERRVNAQPNTDLTESSINRQPPQNGGHTMSLTIPAKNGGERWSQ